MGVVKRIDELGRIVIPKDIRNNLGIREGELLEINIEDKSIIISKKNITKNVVEISKNLIEIMESICNIDIFITDRERVIVTSKNLSLLNNILLDDFFKSIIDNREVYLSKIKENRFNLNKFFIVYPIIIDSLCNGLIVIVSDNVKEEYLNYGKIMQKILTHKLDY